MTSLNFTRIEYLDLEIAHHKKQKINLSENFKISCNIDHLENQFKHIPHTSDSQKNFIVDLLINLGYNLEINLSKINQKLESNNIITLSRNLDYIREVISTLNSQINRFSNKHEIIDLKSPKPVDLEIKRLIENITLEINIVKQVQSELQEQLVHIKRLVSE